VESVFVTYHWLSLCNREEELCLQFGYCNCRDATFVVISRQKTEGLNVGEGCGMVHKIDVSDYRPDSASSRGVITLLTGLALGAAFWGAVFLILAR
jgi:hypothetical protein